MNIKTLLLIQAIIIAFFFVSLYFLVLKIEDIEEKKFNDFLNSIINDNNESIEENSTGIIKNQYIVVLRDNATFIDEFTRTNWIKRAIDDENGSYSKIIHYYSMPKSIGWNTPSESLKLLKKNNINGDNDITTFKGFAAKLSPDMYEYFVRHPSVKYVECDEYVQIDDIIENQSSNEKPIYDISSSLNDNKNDDKNKVDNNDEVEASSVVYKIKSSLNLSRLINHNPVTDINNAYYKFGYESAYDVYVYVVDTGVNADHSSFLDKLGYDTVDKKRVILGKNYLESEGIEDKNGHGTHVAGIIGSTTWGVAKRVNIVSVKVMNKKGSGKWSDIISAIEWCQNHLFNETTSKKGIINISLSGSVKMSANNAIKASISQGVHFTVAAGNNGNNACQYSPASASEYGAVVVGSIGNDDTYSKFSNYGSCITLYAPGYKILSTSNLDNTSFREMSGTSMAAPHVAGVMALILSAKNMSPRDLYNTLINEASVGYIKNLDEESPNLIAYLPQYAIASRCNPLDPYDCINSSYKSKSKNNEENDSLKDYKLREEKVYEDNYIILQNSF
ncbi:subtilisin-like protein [Anaeromyces robustus]|uniref:Subtilisin-like protein n=1 Tax=Anaeromyces robustus TaxID=1754192 RepID=A0A1Y1WU93_9FUNG|nr:subtilisin-like protein [Anaeromyces robustus]|eukprot:ORX77111.1 subtilisin-like protein [Anaeromyces robustus]